MNLLPRLAKCFLDGRNQDLVKHAVSEMLAQRIYGLALGYEDINDREQLRKDPVFGILAGRVELGASPDKRQNRRSAQGNCRRWVLHFPS